MIRINLLPYREEARKAKRQQFISLSVMVTVLSCLIVFLGYSLIEGAISAQQSKNDFLNKEIQALNKQLDEIKSLKEKTAALLERKRIIESLQRNRSETVYLLSELTKQIPEGTYLKLLKQDDAKISLSGYAQSNARISILMRNIDNSPWLEKAQLIEISAAANDRRRLNDFSMDIFIKRPKAPDNQTKPAPKESK